MTQAQLFRLGSLITAVAVGLNALGAHFLSGHLTASELNMFDTASRYLLIGGLWILVFTRQSIRLSERSLSIIMIGLLFFSGSLLAYLITQAKFLMFLTPIGGVMIISGFVLLAIRSKSIN